MKAETSSALDRLQADPRKDGQEHYKWLDSHQADVMTVVREKGQTLTGELLGLGRGTIYSGAKNRGLAPPKKVEPGPSTRQAEASADGSAQYWRGKAQAWREMVELLLKRLGEKGDR